MLDRFFGASRLDREDFACSLRMILSEGRYKKGKERAVDLLKSLVATAYVDCTTYATCKRLCVEYATFARISTYCERKVRLVRVSECCVRIRLVRLRRLCAYDVHLCA